MIDNTLVLGMVVWHGHRGERYAASLQPLAYTTTDHTRWVRAYTNNTERESVFPNSGHISWFPAPTDVREQSVWVFEAVDQPTYDPTNIKHDQYMVARNSDEPIQLAKEVFDVADYGGERDAREVLAQTGLTPPAGDRETIYIRSGGLIATAPLVPKQDGSGLWCLSSSAIEKDPLRFHEWPGDDAAIKICVGGVPRTFFAPGARPSGPPRLRDWAPDEVVLRRVLSRMRRWDKNYAEQIGLTDRVIERIISAVAVPQNAIKDFEMERHRLERAKDFLGRLHTSAELAQAVEQSLMVGPVAEEIAKERLKLHASEVAAARASAEQSITEERTRLATIQSQIEALRAEEKLVREQVDTARHEHEDAVRRLEDGLATRVREIVASPERLLAEVAILRAAGVGANGQVPNRSVTTAIARSIPSKPDANVSILKDVAIFRRQLKHAMMNADVPLSSASGLFSSFLAGVIPVLTGSRAQSAISAFGRVACRGEMLRVPVAATYLDATDVLGRVDHDSRSFRPTRSGLARLLCDAITEADERLHLVILEGVNLAPPESFLLTIMLAYTDCWKRTVPRRLDLFDASEVDADDPFATLGSFRWPKNVLLAATALEGASTLPLPKSIWQYATLILTDQMAHEDLGFVGQTAETSPPVAGDVPLTAWSSWRGTVKDDDVQEAARQWIKMCAKSKMPRGGIDTFTALYAAARSYSEPADISLGIAAAYAALPLIVDTDHSEKAFQGLTTPYVDIKAALDEATRLAGR